MYNLNIKINKISAKNIEGTQINGTLDRSLKSNTHYFNYIQKFEKQLVEMKKFDDERS